MSFSVICRLLQAPPANWTIPLVARARPGFLPDAEYQGIIKDLRELGRMLTSVLNRVDAGRLMAKC